MEKHRKRPVRAEDREAVKTRFIEGLSSGVPITKAAVAAGVSRSQVFNWRKDDEAFAMAWDDAWQAGADAIEYEMRRRGLEGWLEPVFYQGVHVGDIRKFSDTLLIVLHKIRRPEAHRAYQDHGESPGKGGGPAQSESAFEDARKEVEAILDRHQRRRKELAGVPQPPGLSEPVAT
jgi:hypothetical protein